MVLAPLSGSLSQRALIEREDGEHGTSGKEDQKNLAGFYSEWTSRSRSDPFPPLSPPCEAKFRPTTPIIHEHQSSAAPLCAIHDCKSLLTIWSFKRSHSSKLRTFILFFVQRKGKKKKTHDAFRRPADATSFRLHRSPRHFLCSQNKFIQSPCLRVFFHVTL